MAVVMWSGVAVPAGHAQDPDVQSLLQKVQRLQRELNTLQRHVFRGETPPASAQGAAAGAADIGRPQAARLELRLSQFETELRTLTGQVEEQSFRLNQLNQKLDRLVAGLDQRQQQPAPAGVAPQSQTTARAPANPATSRAAANPPVDDGTPRVIGQISQSELQAAQAQSGTAVAAAPNPAGAASGAGGTTPEAKYKHAHNLLNQANYDGAQLALQAFLDEYPDNLLAGNAMYWLGETYYVRKRYDEAAVIFAEGFKNYPDGVKTPDNLLKLGKSLAALGSSEDACGTFTVLLERYAKAAPTILQRARRERQELGCP
jgi:tol-pal system protein YbgF